MRPQFAQTYDLCLVDIRIAFTHLCRRTKINPVSGTSPVLKWCRMYVYDSWYQLIPADIGGGWRVVPWCSCHFMPFFQVPSGRCFQTWSPDRARAICWGQRQVHVAVSSFNKLWGFATTKGACTICFVSLWVIMCHSTSTFMRLWVGVS